MRTRAVWVLRTLWFLLPLTVGRAAVEAIDSAGNGVARTFTVGMWILWGAGLAATAIPLPVTLTMVRILAAGSVPPALWAVLDTGVSATSTAGLAHALLVCVAAFSALVGDRFVDGGSYGDERRMLLKPPAILAFVVIPLIGAAMLAAVAAGPLLLADRRWVIGAVLTIVGMFVVATGFRALHQLNNRWIVFVPTGMVLHDLMVLTEPVLFRRTAIERLGVAIAGSPARDLSHRAAGIMVECELTDPAPLGLRDDPGAATLTDVRRFFFCPSRPGELLDEAARRNIATD